MKPKGRILRVKAGYNPNSSSMGSIVFALPAALAGVSALFGAAAAVLLPLVVKKPAEIERPPEQDKKPEGP